MDEDITKKRMRIMLISVAALFGVIILYKIVGGLLFAHWMSSQKQIVTVTSTKAQKIAWSPIHIASGSVRAINGVNVTTELAGMVQGIYFTPGMDVKEGEVLLQLNADNDIASLHALEASAALAKVTLDRDKLQFAAHAVSKQILDNDEANFKNLTAQVEQQAAIVNKKTIHAPFTGRLGIRQVNLGQYINPGDTIVMLQSVDPVYVDFSVPQQVLPKMAVGSEVKVTSDAYPGKEYVGKITTINPGLDSATRNVEVEATLNNPNHELTPGMFVTVQSSTGADQSYVTLPQSAVTFNSYGELVFILTPDKKEHKLFRAAEKFVKTGDTRGDQVAILSGINPGDQVVTSGQLKLKNNSLAAVDNKIVPEDNPAPKLENDHLN